MTSSGCPSGGEVSQVVVHRRVESCVIVAVTWLGETVFAHLEAPVGEHELGDAQGDAPTRSGS